MRTDRAQIADRVWLALHALPRDERGKPPSLRSLADKGGFDASALTKLFKEERTPQAQMTGIAEALGVSLDWLLRGIGASPKPTGPVPSRRIESGLEPPPRFTGHDHTDPLAAHLPDDPDPARARVIAAARAACAAGSPDYTEADIERIRAVEHREKARGAMPDTAYWWTRLKAEADRRRLLEAAAELQREEAGGLAVAAGDASGGERGHQEATTPEAPQFGGVRPKGARAGRPPTEEDVAAADRRKSR